MAADIPDDAAVIRRSLLEPGHFEVLFVRHAPQIQRYVTRRLGSDAADDVVAETFLAAFRQRADYDGGRPDALPWLYGIATHMIGRHRRSEVRQYRLLARTGLRRLGLLGSNEAWAAPIHARRGGRREYL